MGRAEAAATLRCSWCWKEYFIIGLAFIVGEIEPFDVWPFQWTAWHKQHRVAAGAKHISGIGICDGGGRAEARKHISGIGVCDDGRLHGRLLHDDGRLLLHEDGRLDVELLQLHGDRLPNVGSNELALPLQFEFWADVTQRYSATAPVRRAWGRNWRRRAPR